MTGVNVTLEERAAEIAAHISPIIAAHIAVTVPVRHRTERDEAIVREAEAIVSALDRYDQARNSKNEGYARNQVIRASRQLKQVMEGKRRVRR